MSSPAGTAAGGTGGTAARCARHPEVVAVGVCERCGDYVCEACDDARHPGVCVRCGARFPSGLAWEDPRAGAWPWRGLKSLGQLLRRPSIAFPGPARNGRAFLFVALCGLLVGAMLVGMAVVLMRDPDSYVRMRVREGGLPVVASFALVLLVPALALMVWTPIQAASFAVGLASAGRRAGVMRLALRACAYGQGLLLVCLVPPFVAAVLSALLPASLPLFVTVRVAWIGGCVLWPLLTGRICYWAGRGVGLSGSRASFAALGPALTCIPAAAWVSHEQMVMLEAPRLYLP
ncbi:MAG TPA: hypothetical protein RMH99_14725 [Sandaracinaceae bacterium LLY-WYZ-13_1]|nr:hypothetical protein [Sandaracinaceae bacterium LLY-WYZ-13_1]